MTVLVVVVGLLVILLATLSLAVWKAFDQELGKIDAAEFDDEIDEIRALLVALSDRVDRLDGQAVLNLGECIDETKARKNGTG